MQRSKAPAIAGVSAIVPTVTFQKPASIDTGGPVGALLSLGRYRIQDELGTGAFGRVFRAYDTDLKRDVAIKILKDDLVDSKELNDQFFREAQLMASIHHAGIVAVYDVGEEHGTRYIVTQFLDGGTLHDRLMNEPLSRVQAAEIIRQCAEAIHVAHRAQLYHRDLKPKNIFMDSRGRAHVGDFGLAIRRCDQDQHAGEFAGSLNYMSPEQLRGEAHRLDGRTDVWALGVTFYLMLTGQLPFQGQGKRAINEILERDPLPPRQLDETIPPELERICLKCLEKPVTARYQSAFDLATHLSDWLAVNPSQAQVTIPTLENQPQPFSTGDFASAPTVQQFSQRRSPLMVLVSVTTLLLLVATAGWLSRDFLVALGSSVPVEKAAKNKALIPAAPDPFEIDSFAVRGRAYSVLDIPPRETVWPSKAITTARWFFDDKRQDLAVDVAEYGLLGLAHCESESFRLRVSINRNNWIGSAGVFWGYQLAPTKAGFDFEQCYAIRVTGSLDDNGLTRLDMGLFRMTFKNGQGVAVPSLDQERLEAVEVMRKGSGPYDLVVTVLKNRIASVLWCGEELQTLREPATHPDLLPLSHHGTMGVVVVDSSAEFSDARVTLFD